MPVTENVSWFKIKVNGTDLSHDHMDDLLQVEVDSSLYLPAAATLEFHDLELALADDATLFKIGADIEISVDNNPASGSTASGVVFKGVVAALEPVFAGMDISRFVVRAYDRLHLLHRGASSKTFQQQKDSDIVRTIASAAGLSATVSDTRVVHQHVFRDDQSDFDFIQRLARRNGFVAVADGTTLNFKKPDDLGHADVEVALGEGLMEFRPALTLVGQVDEVAIGGWDRVNKQAVNGNATSAKFQPNETGVTSRGFALLRSAHSAGKLHLTEVAPDQARADAEAGAVFDRLAANDLIAEGIAFGDPRIKPGGKVKVSNLGTRFSGKYFVTRVLHTYDPVTGFNTTFWTGGMNSGTLASLVSDAPRALAPPAKPLPGLFTGVVTNNQDPDKAGRVKLKFPQIAQDAESNWAPVSGAGAGNQRGVWILPEVNDEVLVGFLHGDINYPVVLGGLWNGKDKPPDDTPTGGTVDVRTWKTRAGHIVRLTDKSGQEKIEIIDKTANNSITIDSKQNTLTILAAKDINIEAKGNVTIKGVNVKLEASAKLEAKGSVFQGEAQSQLTLKGAIAELSASGVTKISGSMVNIN